MAASTIPRPASTTLVVRDHADGLQVLMVRRSATASFMPDIYVFPGGAVDPGDGDAASAARCDESEAEAATRLHLPAPALAHAVAALRECFEECGLWLGADGPPADALLAARARLHAGRADMATLSTELGLPLRSSVLSLWAHWVTPIDLPKRFDTRFFIAPAPAGQAPTVDAHETTTLAWIAPAAALAAHRRREFPLSGVTQQILESLGPFATVAELRAHAARQRAGPPTIHPRLVRRPDGGTQTITPAHHAYAEAMHVDPDGSAAVSGVLTPGVAVRLAPTVWRVTAPNPGPMTGPGTNSYVVGRDGEFVVIDPGPAIESHVQALMAASGGRIAALLVTHTHGDHSPAAARLAALTGAPRIGLAAPAHGRQDDGFVAEREPGDGEIFQLAGCTLRALHTPGHASNHVCWLLEDERLLFTGDHVMQGSTVVIDPPDGDMLVYLQSLRRLLEADVAGAIDHFAPGHGFLVGQPRQAVEALLKHRLAREAKVLDALDRSGPATLEQLLPAVYGDVDARLHPVAARSLLAHLQALASQGLAAFSGERWQRGVD